MRLEGKIAVVTGAGQTQGENIGNGRAAAVLFAREARPSALLRYISQNLCERYHADSPRLGS